MNFIAIDVETANADLASICQIGLASYENGVLKSEWKTYVDPEDYFDGLNVSVHGIDEATVEGAPNFQSLSGALRSQLAGKVVVCHTHFDRVAVYQAGRRHHAIALECKWLDSAQVVRRAWTECARKGYGLQDVCAMLGYKFKHHDALEDAKAAAHILLAACSKTGLDIDGWFARVRQPIDLSTGGKLEREGNPNGPLFGEVLAFTGALEIPRHEAADMAAKIGCQVSPTVTRNVTMLVVGDQDVKRLAGHEKSSKHRKAEELAKKGLAIRILRESDFKQLVKLSQN